MFHVDFKLSCVCVIDYISYRAKKQRFPIFICKRHDFMIKIKILPLAAQGEVIQHQMGQIYPAIQQNEDHQKLHSALQISSAVRQTEQKQRSYQVIGSLWMVSGPFVHTEHWNW